MAKKYSSVKNKLMVLGLAATLFVGSMTLTGCTSKELEGAQAYIDSSMTHVLNSEAIQQAENELFSKYTFLCADVNKTDGSMYSVDINGIATRAESEKKAYTTFNYLVSDSYFQNEDELKSSADIINKFAEIIEKENYSSYSISNVKNLDSLNSTMREVTDCPIDGGYHPSGENFLYGVSGVELSEADNVASFSTKELTKFSRTRTEVTYGIKGYFDGKPQYGTIIRSVTDYESFFMEHNIYVKLTPEEMEQAKQDESIVFEKFAEYVKSGQKDKFVVQETNIMDSKQYDANMKDHVDLSKS